MLKWVDPYMVGFAVCGVACAYLLFASFCSGRLDIVPAAAIGLSCSIAGVFVCIKAREVL